MSFCRECTYRNPGQEKCKTGLVQERSFQTWKHCDGFKARTFDEFIDEYIMEYLNAELDHPDRGALRKRIGPIHAILKMLWDRGIIR
jgi:hypothetical protein